MVGVCLYIGEESVINTGGLHRVEDLVDLAALDNDACRSRQKSLLEAAGGQLRADLLDSAGAMVETVLRTIRLTIVKPSFRFTTI